MENFSDPSEEREISSDTNNTIKNKENSLRLRLVRVFSIGALKSPKSPVSVSSSQSTSPGGNSPCAKSRYSWQLPLSNKECHTPSSTDSGVSFSSSKSMPSTANSPSSAFNPQSPCSSKWYVSEK
ncbi:putative protein TPRXL isoform X2 [Osmia bicornis bicornis]|uniref:putative protein TPRXL isoform X2 n=1 Tax=Osmia bicornis bicornis TaxID=1437191 RepID=UPI0010F9618F|nr:putative protein TPRXL isoform X2 [Osmia bicornis bicornis]